MAVIPVNIPIGPGAVIKLTRNRLTVPIVPEREGQYVPVSIGTIVVTVMHPVMLFRERYIHDID